MTAISFADQITVNVGTVVEVLNDEFKKALKQSDKRSWYLYVTALFPEQKDAEVHGLFIYTDVNVRQASGCVRFVSEKLFLTHEEFSAPLGSVKGVVEVLPSVL